MCAASIRSSSGVTPASDSPKLPDVVARCVRVAVLIGVAVTIAESWVVQVLALVDETEWDVITRSSRTAGFTLFVAYVVWELFKYQTDPYMARKNKSAADAIADGDATGAAGLAHQHHDAAPAGGGGDPHQPSSPS